MSACLECGMHGGGHWAHCHAYPKVPSYHWQLVRPGVVSSTTSAEPESAANGPSETRPEHLRRAAAALRASAYTDKALYCQIADLLEAAATVGSYGVIADAADRLARSLLGEPEVDR